MEDYLVQALAIAEKCIGRVLLAACRHLLECRPTLVWHFAQSRASGSMQAAADRKRHCGKVSSSAATFPAACLFLTQIRLAMQADS